MKLTNFQWVVISRVDRTNLLKMRGWHAHGTAPDSGGHVAKLCERRSTATCSATAWEGKAVVQVTDQMKSAKKIYGNPGKAVEEGPEVKEEETEETASHPEVGGLAAAKMCGESSE